MTDVSDEMLMAYADGELEAHDRTRVEAYLEQSADGRHRLAVFTATGRRLAGLFDQPIREPVPQRLIDAVMGARPQNGHVVGLDKARRARAPSSAPPSWALLAASVSLIAVGAGLYLRSNASLNADDAFAVSLSAAGERIAVAELAQTLDATPSGSAAVRDIGGVAATIKPVFTFATAANGYCRQYVISRTAGISLGGVACRDGSGQWRIETHVPFLPEHSNDGQIVTAGKSDLPAVEATVDQLISGDVLSAGDEAALMHSGWKDVQPKP